MPPVRSWQSWSDDDTSCPLIRPWLDVPQAEIASYAAKHGLTWIDDPSNDDLSLRRNALRHRVIPRMKELYPTWEQKTARIAQRLWRANRQHMISWQGSGLWPETSCLDPEVFAGIAIHDQDLALGLTLRSWSWPIPAIGGLG